MHADNRAKPINIALPTLGGRQFWADVQAADGWRIQANVLTGHHRLLDERDIRRAWGSIDVCQTRLANRMTAPRHPNLVVFLHGLGRTKGSFTKSAAAFEVAGFDVLKINYPSLCCGLDTIANQLDELLIGLAGYQSVSFVTHSFGALVVRALLARDSAWRTKLPVNGVVMVAPPNRGSRLADRLSRYMPSYRGFGKALNEATSPIATNLPSLDVPYLIIAGSTRGGRGRNPLLDGDDDGIAAVAETLLRADDPVMRVPVGHTTISNHPQTIAAVLAFLKDHLSIAYSQLRYETDLGRSQ